MYVGICKIYTSALITFLTMVSKSKRGGIGAVGKAPACFFDPSEPIRARYTNPEEYKRAVLTGVTLISRARERLLKR